MLSTSRCPTRPRSRSRSWPRATDRRRRGCRRRRQRIRCRPSHGAGGPGRRAGIGLAPASSGTRRAGEPAMSVTMPSMPGRSIQRMRRVISRPPCRAPPARRRRPGATARGRRPSPQRAAVRARRRAARAARLPTSRPRYRSGIALIGPPSFAGHAGSRRLRLWRARGAHLRHPACGAGSLRHVRSSLRHSPERGRGVNETCQLRPHS